jgi:hypothetical protein
MTAIKVSYMVTLLSGNERQWNSFIISWITA